MPISPNKLLSSIGSDFSSTHTPSLVFFLLPIVFQLLHLFSNSQACLACFQLFLKISFPRKTQASPPYLMYAAAQITTSSLILLVQKSHSYLFSIHISMWLITLDVISVIYILVFDFLSFLSLVFLTKIKVQGGIRLCHISLWE